MQSAPVAKGKIERRHDCWQKRLVPLLAAERIVELTGANQWLDQLVAHAQPHERHRALGGTPPAAPMPWVALRLESADWRPRR